MAEGDNTFKRAPKRKPNRGKSVSVSPEARQAYADLIKARGDKQESYGRHLPSDPPKGR